MASTACSHEVAFGSKHVAALHTQARSTRHGQRRPAGPRQHERLYRAAIGGRPGLGPVAQVACGKSHCLALTAEGDVYSWGASDEGQLGTGRTAPAFVPRYLSALPGDAGSDDLDGRVALRRPLRLRPHLHLGRSSVRTARPRPAAGLAVAARRGWTPRQRAPSSPTAARWRAASSTRWRSRRTASSTPGASATAAPLSPRKCTPLPELVSTGLAEGGGAEEERIKAIACGGGSTILISEGGTVVCWPGTGKQPSALPIPKPLRASRAAVSGTGALVFVETAITKITQTFAPSTTTSRALTSPSTCFYDSLALSLPPFRSRENLVQRVR